MMYCQVKLHLTDQLIIFDIIDFLQFELFTVSKIFIIINRDFIYFVGLNLLLCFCEFAQLIGEPSMAAII